MDKNFPAVAPGDRLSADLVNQITRSVNELQEEGGPTGMQRANVGGVRGTAARHTDIIMVRITGIVVPKGSTLYSDALQYITDVQGNSGSVAYNAVVQLYDFESEQWGDDPSGECIEVSVPEDAIGWKPLIVNDQVPVLWKKSADKYIPLDTRETSIIMITSFAPDDGGFYSGVLMSWSSESQTWVTGGACWVLNIGS